MMGEGGRLIIFVKMRRGALIYWFKIRRWGSLDKEGRKGGD